MKKLFAAMAAMGAAFAQGATLEVGAGKAYASPEAALAAASDGDVILIDDGTYVLTAELQVAKAVTFKSASGDRAKCVISGGDAVPLVYIADDVNKHIVFDSVTLTKGWGAYYSVGYPTRAFRAVNGYLLRRAARFLNRKSQRRYRLKFADTYYGELNHYGMYWLKWANVRRAG